MVITAIVFFIILSILVLVHELGHFLVARFLGVGVEEFGLGLPPRVVGKKIRGTIYSVNWLPIGGFVKLAGEDEKERKTEKGKRKNVSEYFWARSKKERAAMLVAGVAMNFLLAVVITTGLLIDGVKEPSGRVHVERVIEGSPAQEGGLLPNDVILTADRWPKITPEVRPLTEMTTTKQLIEFTKANAGKTIQLEILRGGETLLVRLVPRASPPAGEGPMGVAISDLEERRYPWWQAPFVAGRVTILRAGQMLTSIVLSLWRVMTLQPLGVDIAGPIGIAQVTGQAVKFGLKAVLEFMSILSLNLAVLNILPIPALDGGRLAFVFLEKVLGRRVWPAFEKSTHQIGMVILFALILLITINDILRLARG